MCACVVTGGKFTAIHFAVQSRDTSLSKAPPMRRWYFPFFLVFWLLVPPFVLPWTRRAIPGRVKCVCVCAFGWALVCLGYVCVCVHLRGCPCVRLSRCLCLSPSLSSSVCVCPGADPHAKESREREGSCPTFWSMLTTYKIKKKRKEKRESQRGNGVKNKTNTSSWKSEVRWPSALTNTHKRTKKFTKVRDNLTF